MIKYQFTEVPGALFLWVIFGSPIVTLLLGTVWWSSVLLWNYLWNAPEALYQAAVLIPAASIITFVTASIAQIMTYPALIFFTVLLVIFFGRVSLVLLLAVTPLLAWLTWFGYDRIVPDYRFMLDQSAPYEHGLTLTRFLLSWGWSIALVAGFWWPLRKLRLTGASLPVEN